VVCLDSGNQWPLECGGEGGRFVYGEDCSGWPINLQVYMTRLSPPQWASRLPLHPPTKHSAYFITLFHILSQPAMADVNLDSIHYYQPLASEIRPVQRCPAAWNCGASMVSNAHGNSMAPAPNVSPSARLADHALSECVDLTTSSPMESLDLFGELALDFAGTESCAKGNVHLP